MTVILSRNYRSVITLNDVSAADCEQLRALLLKYNVAVLNDDDEREPTGMLAKGEPDPRD